MFNERAPIGMKRQGGFSLVELMIVVGIIGILSALAIPRFQRFQAKARMAEAKNMLSHVFTLQEAYHLEQNQYKNFAASKQGNSANGNCGNADMQEIGFELSPCNKTVPRYIYQTTGANTSVFLSTARSNAGNSNFVCPGDPEHTFAIDQNRDLRFKRGSTPAGAGAGESPRCK